MKFNSTSNKIKDIFEQTFQNQYNLFKKINNFKILKSTDNYIKVPTILYDSGWLTATEELPGG